MAIELKQQLRLSQQLVMTPQLQQAIKLLQLNRLELVGLVQQELEENPVLEEIADDEGEASPDEIEAAEASASSTSAEARAEDAPNAGDDVTDAEKIAELEWQDYLNSNPQVSSPSAGGDERPSIDATLTRRDTLTEHLEWQLQLTQLPIEEEIAARFIIGNLDDRGYLQATISELARQSGMSEETVERALARVQALDPIGVAARDLRECLLVQARALEIEDPLVIRIL
ncbi:MAG TPA: RNA polymerase sigma-54 factor, partial [Myxococcota bacterium]|nr:RNA polymerase sigma-54 factor [Myxococcota bacterium]